MSQTTPAGVAEQRYGRDLVWRGDFEVTARGDLKLTKGPASILENVKRSLVTVPGELFWRRNYGIGINLDVNLPAATAHVLEMKNRIRATLLGSPHISKVDPLEVQLQGGGLTRLTLGIHLAGGQQTNLEIELGRTF